MATPLDPVAVVRRPTADLVECRLTHMARDVIDPDLALRQHAEYARVLAAHGYRVEYLPTMHGHADAVFVEDAALVLPEVAVVARSGAEGRRAEAPSVRRWLDDWHPNVIEMKAPATLDGGDVLVIERTIHVGHSTRTNRSAVDVLRRVTEPHGYSVTAVDVHGALHLKTAATYLGAGTLVVNPAWIEPDRFHHVERAIPVHEAEPFAANCVRLPDAILTALAQPRTTEAIARMGFTVAPVDISEFAKAEAGVTCLSILCGDVVDPGASSGQRTELGREAW